MTASTYQTQLFLVSKLFRIRITKGFSIDELVYSTLTRLWAQSLFRKMNQLFNFLYSLDMPHATIVIYTSSTQNSNFEKHLILIVWAANYDPILGDIFGRDGNHVALGPIRLGRAYSYRCRSSW
jgi:hypothetical protein